MAETGSLNTGLARYLSPEQLQTQSSFRVGIAGAGGLGSNVAMHLVRSGMKRFVIADFDQVEASNLNRQFYFPDQIGMKKVEALSENLMRLTPDLDLCLHPTRLTAETIRSVFSGCDVVVEALDDPAAKKMLVEAFWQSEKQVVTASGIGGFGRADTIGYRRIRNNLQLVGDETTPSDATIPPMSPRVGIAAAMQADLVMEIVLGRCPAEGGS